MKTFKDNVGRTWNLQINIDAIKRVRSLLDVNLLDAVDGKLLERLCSDPVLLCDVLYALVKPEADSKNVTDEGFGRGMAGDAIEHATTALLEELTDFFPQARRRILKKALGKLKTFEERAIAVADKRLDDPELDREIEAILNGIGASSGSSPDPSASIPDP